MTYKTKFAMPAKFLPLLFLLALSSAATANTICANGSSTDADGDGWGWENGQSCLVADDSSGGGGQPTDTSGCDYSNAPSNDGWGWNNTTGTSCPPVAEGGNNQPPANTAASPHDAMTALITGGWDCSRQFPHYNTTELNEMINGTAGGWIFGAVESWKTYAHLACSHMNPNCGRGASVQFWHQWTLDFQPNGQVLIDRNEGQGHDRYWVGRTQHSWQLSRADAQLVLTPEPASPLWGQFSEIGFEWFNGERYMHLYQAEADSPRLTCKARP